MEIEVNLTGGTYGHKSKPVSNQVTRNFWPQLVDDQITKNKYILESWVGQTLFGTVSGVGRGTFNHRGTLYRVAGTLLYSVNSAGTHTSLGTIPGTERCRFDGLGADLIVVSERRVFVWNGSTLTEVTDPDLQSPDSVAVLNQQAIYDGNNDQFGVSDVGDPSTINALNYATAESKSDNLVRVYAWDQLAWMFGEKTIEQWWNSGVGQPPFDRVQGGIIEKGLAAIDAVANNSENLFFLGVDKKIYAVRGATTQGVSDEALVRKIGEFSSISDAIFWCMNIRNQEFLVATFPTGDKTFVLPIGGQWFEWSSGVNGGRNVANSYVNIYDKHLVEDYQNGNIYELDFDTYTENTATIVRQRDSAPIDGAMLGFPDKKIFLNAVTLNLETGVGLISGQGSNPLVMLSYSDDGGKTWSTERWRSIGTLGQFKKRVRWTNLGSFYERIFRFRTSDPVYYCIRSAMFDIEVGV